MGEWLSDVFFGWIYDVFYTLQKSICYLLDFIRDIFCKLAGIETVNIGGSQEEILTHFILSPEIRNAFLGVLLVGVILLFVFVIIAIIESEAADPQHKKTKGQILVKSLQSFVIFLLIPFLLIAGIMLANVVVGAIHASMTGSMVDGNTASTIGGQILVTSGYDAYIGPGGKPRGNRADVYYGTARLQLAVRRQAILRPFRNELFCRHYGRLGNTRDVRDVGGYVRTEDIRYYPIVYRIPGIGIDHSARRRRQVPYLAGNARVEGAVRLRYHTVDEYLLSRRAANLADHLFRQRFQRRNRAAPVRDRRRVLDYESEHDNRPAHRLERGYAGNAADDE